jgi:hypothetical protein
LVGSAALGAEVGAGAGVGVAFGPHAVTTSAKSSNIVITVKRFMELLLPFR